MLQILNRASSEFANMEQTQYKQTDKRNTLATYSSNFSVPHFGSYIDCDRFSWLLVTS